MTNQSLSTTGCGLLHSPALDFTRVFAICAVVVPLLLVALASASMNDSVVFVQTLLVDFERLLVLLAAMLALRCIYLAVPINGSAHMNTSTGFDTKFIGA